MIYNLIYDMMWCDVILWYICDVDDTEWFGVVYELSGVLIMVYQVINGS